MSDLYDRDFYAWINTQVSLLQAGDFASADMENIVEELATLARQEKRELRKRLVVLLHHLLKWQFQTGLRSGSFALSLEIARDAVADFLSESPSLKELLPKMMVSAYRTARSEMVIDTGFGLETFPADCPWTFEQAMRDAP